MGGNQRWLSDPLIELCNNNSNKEKIYHILMKGKNLLLIIFLSFIIFLENISNSKPNMSLKLDFVFLEDFCPYNLF